MTLEQVVRAVEGTCDGDVYMLVRELVASGDRSAIAPARAALEHYAAERNWYGRDVMAQLLAGLASVETFPRLLGLYADAMRRDDGDDWDSLGQALCTAMRADPAGCRTVLLPMLSDRDQHVRRAALWTIGYVFEPSDMATLRDALADPDPWIRFTALGSLPTAKDNPEIYHLLVAMLRDPDQWVQREAVLLLAWSAPPMVVDHLIPLASDPGFHARSALGEAIGRRAANSDRIPAAAAALRQLLADPEPAVRVGAVRGIGLLGQPLDRLESMVDDPDWRVRSAVADVSARHRPSR
ncbi:HEAT repeat domain-containing protein [Micromonospora sp. NPDC093277]|uniref:HEAT repeat domain-containing protein n=1 Tax=Micromonospora sp. NPDC093277 TaxID=3364291 RepID=UPI0037FE5B4D